MATILQIGLENAATATVLAALTALLAWRLKGRPAVIHCLYLVVLLKLVTPPLWRVPIIPAPATAVVAAAAAETSIEIPAISIPTYQFLSEVSGDDLDAVIGQGEDPNSIIEFSNDPIPALVAPPFVEPPALPRFSNWDILGATWLAGSVGCSIVVVSRVLRFRRVLGLVKPAPEPVEDLVHDVADRIELARTPRVGMVSGSISPMVWCLGLRPFLILPGELWKRLDDPQRRTLLAHELAHLKRGDHFVRLFELAVTVLFWWLPVVWWVRKGLREAEEQCCDAWVVWAFPEASKAYAETLVETIDFLSGDRSPLPAFASGIGRIQHLKRRLCMIMSGKTPHTLGYGGTLAALTLSALLLPLSPSMAQKAEEKPEKQEVRVIVKHGDEVVTEDVVGAVDAAEVGNGVSAKAVVILRTIEDGKDVGTIPYVLSDVVNVGDRHEAKQKLVEKIQKEVSEVRFQDANNVDKVNLSVAGQVLNFTHSPKVFTITSWDDQDEDMDVRVIVKGADEDDAKNTSNTFTFTAVAADKTVDEAMKKAVDQLKKQLDEMKAKKDKGKGDEMAIKALTKAIESLGKRDLKVVVVPVKPGSEGKKVETTIVGSDEGFTLGETIIYKRNQGATARQKLNLAQRLVELTPEKMAERQEIFSLMKSLQADAEKSQAEMRKALANLVQTHKRLAELSRKVAGGQAATEEVMNVMLKLEADLERAEDRLKWSDEMLEKGYVSQGQNDSERRNRQRANFALEQAQTKRNVLEKYTKEKTVKELKSEVEKARRSLEEIGNPVAAPVPPVPPSAPRSPLQFREPASPPDQHRRIDELEKKLDRILDQLDSLKKSNDKAK